MGMIEDIREAVKIVQQIDNIELYKKLLDLQAEALEFAEQLKNKDKRIEELERALELKGKLVIRNSAYFSVDDNGQIVDGPFCTKCFDVDHIMCRIVRDVPEGRKWVRCQKCNKPFTSYKVYEYIQTGQL